MNKVFIVTGNLNAFEYVHQHVFFKDKKVQYINPKYGAEKFFGLRDCTLIIYGDTFFENIDVILAIAKSRNFSIFVMDDERGLRV